MPKLDLAAAATVTGTRYPDAFAGPCRARRVQRLAEAAGLTQFGFNRVTLPPGTWSSQRHWHSHEDEFVYVLSGELVLVTDAGEEILKAGDAAGFRAGVADGHCLQNRSAGPAEFLVAGSRNDLDHAEYPGLDLIASPGRYSGKGGFHHLDGTPY